MDVQVREKLAWLDVTSAGAVMWKATQPAVEFVISRKNCRVFSPAAALTLAGAGRVKVNPGVLEAASSLYETTPAALAVNFAVKVSVCGQVPL